MPPSGPSQNYPRDKSIEVIMRPPEHWGTLPAELPDTRKGPHRIAHVILRPLVSGTQRLSVFQASTIGQAFVIEKDKPCFCIYRGP
jgi:hypothetical protein